DTLQSPWVDLTVSTPSIINDDCADFVPNQKRGSAVNFAESPASKEYKEKDAALAEKIKNQILVPKFGMIPLIDPREDYNYT
ncbi:unnamed protein product, partial [Rhizophagus irregularis]